MDGEISFDTIFSEEDGVHDIEGCYRLEGQDWCVFYFTHWHKGNAWTNAPLIKKDAVWRSGIRGVDVIYPISEKLNKVTVKAVLSETLNIENWVEVKGPDSLQLK